MPRAMIRTIKDKAQQHLHFPFFSRVTFTSFATISEYSIWFQLIDQNAINIRRCVQCKWWSYYQHGWDFFLEPAIDLCEIYATIKQNPFNDLTNIVANNPAWVFFDLFSESAEAGKKTRQLLYPLLNNDSKLINFHCHWLRIEELSNE